MDDFQKIQNRKQTNSVKWDSLDKAFQTEDLLPMWIADMDFKAPEAVNEVIKERADHGIYGYTTIDESVKQTVKNWVQSKHEWNIQTNTLVFSPGVITSLYTVIQEFTKPNDKILVQTPVYTPFFNLVQKENRELIENELLFDGEKYKLDYDDFEAKIKSGVKAFILCSPHNPVGRVWKKEELEKMAQICLDNDVLIISDEIHADLVYPAYNHIPIASLSERVAEQTITCMSPTKTFNLAGLQASFMIVPNKKRRSIIESKLGLQGFGQLNTIGTIAMEAAYTHGHAWLQTLMGVLTENKQIARKRLIEETNGKLHVLDPEATYLLWIDCSKLGMKAQNLQTFMTHEAKVGLNAGTSYGDAGEQFMRINIACPRQTLEEGINRIIQAVNNLS